MKKGKTYSVFLPSLMATSLMTLFSYMLSKRMKNNFNEPELLAHFIEECAGC